MRRNKRQGSGAGNRKGPLAGQRWQIRLGLLVLGFTAIVAGVFLFIYEQRTGAQGQASPAAPESTVRPEAKAEFEKLKGRWVRPDGGYVVEIREIDAQGKMRAAYFNPRPINVSQATAAVDGTILKVFIELRDVNYPGATYHLTYDPERDQLQGVYFQPALQQRFDVFFVRPK